MEFSKNSLNIVFLLLVLPQLALSSFSHAAFTIWNRLNGFLSRLKSHHQILSCGPIIPVPLSRERTQPYFLTKLGSIKLRSLSGLDFFLYHVFIPHASIKCQSICLHLLIQNETIGDLVF